MRRKLQVPTGVCAEFPNTPPPRPPFRRKDLRACETFVKEACLWLYPLRPRPISDSKMN